MRYFWSLILFLALQTICGAAEAAATQNDLLVAARALGFLEHPPKGDVIVGIVYVPESAQSLHDAQDLQQKIGGGLRAGSLTLKPQLVKLEDLSTAKIGLILLADGAGDAAAGLSQVTAERHLPCITFDIPQVQNGSCTMGVRADPKVEILVNHTAEVNSGISFAAVFRMMITEF